MKPVFIDTHADLQLAHFDAEVIQRAFIYMFVLYR